MIKRLVNQSSTKTIGGIILPESAQKKENPIGKVSAIGSDVNISEIQVGKLVVLPDYKGQSLYFEGEEYDLYRAEELLGFVEEQP